MSHKSLSKLDAPKTITNNEKIISQNDFIVSKTDTKGKIIYCNEIFADMAGYPIGDLIGANHNLIRHPDMPKLAYKYLWDLVQAKDEFFGFVKNLRADGGYYWVFAYITPDLDNNGNIVSYTSVRRKMPQSAIDIITPIYKQLIEAEQNGGVAASEKILQDLLTQNNMEYKEFITNLQLGATL
ncbi:PUTATIVE SIGNAL-TRANSDUCTION SENSOR PROTEIN [hydrothermal vent metagenome]|uniref:PUTATIVE SIGNAL-TRANSDUCTION SENSOR PROTEIN n=1 Tax=hydrothermal vent metagenome TaxID=652676 RepID=A0A1W1CJJ4_9ZZZZ